MLLTGAGVTGVTGVAGVTWWSFRFNKQRNSGAYRLINTNYCIIICTNCLDNHYKSGDRNDNGNKHRHKPN